MRLIGGPQLHVIYTHYLFAYAISQSWVTIIALKYSKTPIYTIIPRRATTKFYLDHLSLNRPHHQPLSYGSGGE